jgi:hypothetical protein
MKRRDDVDLVAPIAGGEVHFYSMIADRSAFVYRMYP